MKELSILIVDDDADVRLAAKLALAPYASRIQTGADSAAMEPLLSPGRFDCVLLDMNFALGERSCRAGMDGLAAIQAVDPALQVVLMTSYEQTWTLDCPSQAPSPSAWPGASWPRPA